METGHNDLAIAGTSQLQLRRDNSIYGDDHSHTDTLDIVLADCTENID